jgi:hypothetical protein
MFKAESIPGISAIEGINSPNAKRMKEYNVRRPLTMNERMHIMEIYPSLINDSQYLDLYL